MSSDGSLKDWSNRPSLRSSGRGLASAQLKRIGQPQLDINPFRSASPCYEVYSFDLMPTCSRSRHARSLDCVT